MRSKGDKANKSRKIRRRKLAQFRAEREEKQDARNELDNDIRELAVKINVVGARIGVDKHVTKKRKLMQKCVFLSCNNFTGGL
jgi:uncharacterized coiled-coil DUF342 family protein